MVFVATAGLGGYGLARAALSPVERLRREVASVSARDPAPGLQVPRTRDEIAALAVTMNELLGRLQGSLARQRALVADASHELRTPFAVLRGELELAGRPGRSREELAAAVDRASEEVARLARITEQLLFLARSDEDRIQPRLEPASISALLTRSAEHADARGREAGVTLRVDAPAGLMAEIDPDRIREAVDNLVDNALQFAPAGTPVVISARAAGPGLVVEVRDAGPGFPAEFLPDAFGRFARPDSGRARSDGGAGLGLAIVNAIALAHGGRATARNLPGGGAVVTLELPGAGADRSGAGGLVPEPPHRVTGSSRFLQQGGPPVVPSGPQSCSAGADFGSSQTRPRSRKGDRGHDHDADGHGVRGTVLGLLAEVDGRDHGRADSGGELLDGAQRAAGAAGLGGSHVADRDVIDAGEAGAHAEPEDEE